MSDYLMRDDAPFSDEEWEKLDELVVGVARKLLVGRRFIQLTGPLGAGVQTVPVPAVGSAEACLHDQEGCACEAGECEVIQVTGHKFLSLPLIHQDFRLAWRDIEASRRMGWPLELGPAAAASAACARAEDELIFHGHPEHGYEGLLNATGRHTVSLDDWDESARPLPISWPPPRRWWPMVSTSPLPSYSATRCMPRLSALPRVRVGWRAS